MFVWNNALSFDVSGGTRTIASITRSFEKAAGVDNEKSSFYDRFNDGLVTLVHECMKRVIARTCEIEMRVKGLLERFLNLLITDSTIVRLHKTMRTHTYLFMMIFLLLVLSQAFSQELNIVPEEGLLPAQGTGYIINKTDIKQVERILGQPEGKVTQENGRITVYNYESKWGVMLFFETSSGKLAMISVLSSLYKTKNGIKVGSSYAEIQNEYGQPLSSGKSFEGTSATYAGIVFILENEKVKTILIGKTQ